MEAVKARSVSPARSSNSSSIVRTDPKFKPASREALQQGYVAIGKRLDATLPRMFATMPKTPLEIRPVPALTEKGAARGSYNSRALPTGRGRACSISTPMICRRGRRRAMETLYLHEGAPGHHFQISLAQENAALPEFQRFGGNTAYVEGWGLYAETLGKELGVYTDPYQYFGYLDSQLFRAIRLVVDTGIHSKGWTRDQTIQYILDNTLARAQPMPPPRPSATSPIRGRRCPTRSASSRSANCARAARKHSARSSTSASSTPRC